jgi:hypothetical protein
MMLLMVVLMVMLVMIVIRHLRLQKWVRLLTRHIRFICSRTIRILLDASVGVDDHALLSRIRIHSQSRLLLRALGGGARLRILRQFPPNTALQALIDDFTIRGKLPVREMRAVEDVSLLLVRGRVVLAFLEDERGDVRLLVLVDLLACPTTVDWGRDFQLHDIAGLRIS